MSRTDVRTKLCEHVFFTSLVLLSFIENKILSLGMRNEIIHEDYPEEFWNDYNQVAKFDIMITAHIASFPPIPSSFSEPKGWKKVSSVLLCSKVLFQQLWMKRLSCERQL
jgi:hypothetical protein